MSKLFILIRLLHRHVYVHRLHFCSVVFALRGDCRDPQKGKEHLATLICRVQPRGTVAFKTSRRSPCAFDWRSLACARRSKPPLERPFVKAAFQRVQACISKRVGFDGTADRHT